jgi:deazaflavin-dependent oxidoreductase (nitroreductase family)
LACISEDGRYVITASKGGASDNPTWYAQLTSAGVASVEVGTATFPVVAWEVNGAKRDRLYSALADRLPVFDQYAARTARIIPVTLLERRG